MQETEIHERVESFCTEGQGWEFSGTQSLAVRSLSRGAGSKQLL